MLEIYIQTSYDQNVQLILKSYLPVVYGTSLTYNTNIAYSNILTVSVHDECYSRNASCALI